MTLLTAIVGCCKIGAIIWDGDVSFMRSILVLLLLVALSSTAFEIAAAAPVTPAFQAAPPSLPETPAKPAKPHAVERGWLSEQWMQVPIIGEQILKHQTLSRPR